MEADARFFGNRLLPETARGDSESTGQRRILAAALCYALNVPCSKLLLNRILPACMAALLYLGAGAGVGISRLFHRRHEAGEESLNKDDLPYTVGMIVLDIIVPPLLMIGVSLGTSSNASRQENFEIVAATLIALLVFRESVSRQLWVAIGFITFFSILLSFNGSGSLQFSIGALFVLGAAACWGLENDCTKKLLAMQKPAPFLNNKAGRFFRKSNGLPAFYLLSGGSASGGISSHSD